MENITCSYCENEINTDSDFCPYCGTLCLGNIKCKNHEDVDAQGVCLICEEPFCNQCGGRRNHKFFCSAHDDYEVYQGMAKVYGSSDYVQCSYIIDALKNEGINALMYNRKTSPLHLGGTDYSLFRASETLTGI